MKRKKYSAVDFLLVTFLVCGHAVADFTNVVFEANAVAGQMGGNHFYWDNVPLRPHEGA